MRRYAFYIAVALLAFGLGSLIYFVFYGNNTEDFSKVKVTVLSETQNIENSFENRETIQPKFVKFRLKDLPCEDETLKIVWHELKDEMAEINETRAGDFENCTDFIEVADFFHTDKELDLNNDGVKEIFIRGVENPYSRCGNNCSTYWIFQKTGEKKYRKLFEAEGYLPIVKKRKTMGYKDILFEVYMREFESQNVLFRFDGKEYVPRQCWLESNLYKNKNGELTVGKKFKTEYLDCKESGYITNFRNYSDRQ